MISGTGLSFENLSKKQLSKMAYLLMDQRHLTIQSSIKVFQTYLRSQLNHNLILLTLLLNLKKTWTSLRKVICIHILDKSKVVKEATLAMVKEFCCLITKSLFKAIERYARVVKDRALVECSYSNQEAYFKWLHMEDQYSPDVKKGDLWIGSKQWSNIMKYETGQRLLRGN